MTKSPVCNALMMQVYQTGLAVDDVTLYLDTHPCDAEALNYFNTVSAQYRDALTAYQNQCGPLISAHQKCASSWDWDDDPWPWERRC